MVLSSSANRQIQIAIFVQSASQPSTKRTQKIIATAYLRVDYCTNLLHALATSILIVIIWFSFKFIPSNHNIIADFRFHDPVIHRKQQQK